MAHIENLEDWTSNLGLLPVNLYPSQDASNTYVLLDGFKGDFCLQLGGDEIEPNDCNSIAWSSNTRNYVFVSDDGVNIHNWLKPKVEFAKRSTVEGNFEKFYEYLNASPSINRNDVISFVLSIYKKLRNRLDENGANATHSLNLLLLLFAINESNKEPNELDFGFWGLEHAEIPDDFDQYVIEFARGVRDGLQPRTDLILRHASGVLFEETAKRVDGFDKSISLFDTTFSSEYSAQSPPYSSVHYTPAFLRGCVVENAIGLIDFESCKKLTVFDPACGSSEFLLEALKQLKTLNFSGHVNVIGWDRSTTAIQTSNFLLSYEAREWGDRLTINLEHVDDSLSHDWPQSCDLILMNPPFQSWEQMEGDQRAIVRDILGGSFQKRPNQASAFLLMAADSLSQDGVLGTVLPSSFLVLDSYAFLRKRLTETLGIRILGKLGNFLFSNAMTDVSMLIANRDHDDEELTMLWTANKKGVVTNAIRDLRRFQAGKIAEIGSSSHSVYEIDRQRLLTLNDWKVSSLKDCKMRELLEEAVDTKTLTRIKYVFDVKQGVRTGSNEVFKVSASFYNSLPQPERVYFRPAVDNKSVRSGALQLSSYIWYPYDENGLTLHNEDALIANVPEFYRLKLLPNRDHLQNRDLPNNGNWWELNRHRAWLASHEPRLVSTEFGRSDSFAFDEFGEFVIERGYAWLLKHHRDSTDPYFFYLVLFCSSFFDQLLSIYSRQLAGGEWFDLGNKFVKDIPIPRFRGSQEDMRLVAIGQKIAGNIHTDFAELGPLVAAQYNLYPE